MRRDLGVLPAVFPMPVLMIGTYDGNGKVNVMNMAWGNISTGEKIVLNMGSDRKTLANIRLKKAPMLMPLLFRSSPLPWNVNCWRSGKWRKAVSLPDGLSM